MLHPFPKRGTDRAFTMIEMLVTLALLSVLAALGGTVFLQAKAKARTIQCLANQHQITTALVAYYEDNTRFPPDAQYEDLAMALCDYIPWPASRHDLILPQVYKCPNDREGKLRNSYAPYYVRRKDPTAMDSFVLGCPRHGDASEAYLNTLGLHGAASGTAGQITVNDVAVSPEDMYNLRSMQSGEMRFADKSSAKVMLATENYRVTAVASFHLDDGRLYSVVRIDGSGNTDFSVTPGSKFEVVTPVAIIGVRGTGFSVTSDDGYAKITVTSGVVHVWDRITEQEYFLGTGDELAIGPNPPSLEELCIECPRHCKSGSHCRRCPLHVGRPDRIGTAYCVQCSMHSAPFLWSSPRPLDHCKRFCTLADKRISNDEIDTDWWPFW